MNEPRRFPVAWSRALLRLPALRYIASLLAVAVAVTVAVTATLGAFPPAFAQAVPTTPPPDGLARATFAGGCFWCMEPPFDKLDGVVSTTSGYIGGMLQRPNYKRVTAGGTGHTEAVEIVYDPKKVSYERLLHVFWRNIDPTVNDRQFCDIGSHYRPEIFHHDDEQRRLAEASRAELEKTRPFPAPIVVPITRATDFWVAEDYHQDYYLKNPIRYRHYRSGCGRDQRLKALWGDQAGG